MPHPPPQAIFKGEIDMAPGEVAGSEEHCEVILYTSDEDALEAIEQWFMAKDGQDAEREAEQEVMRRSMSIMSERPDTR